MKLVSIVVQAYNSDDTIIDTLESIKQQTYDNIELIVSDDKSKDQTVEVVKKWMNENGDKFTRTELVTTKKNTGIAGNNNRALSHVTGEYVEFLAADDLLTEQAVEKYVAFCEENIGKIPIAKVQLFSNEECDFSSLNDYCANCYNFAKLEKQEQTKILLTKNVIVAPAASFYPTQLVKAVNGFEEDYKCFEDYPMNLKLLKKGYSFGFIDEELIKYRISAKSITGSDLTPLKRDEIKLFFKQRMWYMMENGMAWEAVKQLKYWIPMAMKYK